MLRYQVEALPKLAGNTVKNYRSDIKHLNAFFADGPREQIRPMHIKQISGDHSDKPTTANRCKLLFSTIWNHARGWGYTGLANPCEGIRGHAVQKRTVYITDEVFAAVYSHANAQLRDAMDMAYLTGQRPADALQMTSHDIVEGHLIITEQKTKQPLRIEIRGELADFLHRIETRKEGHKIVTAALLVNAHGRRLTAPALRSSFDKAKIAAAAAMPGLAVVIKAFRFYDLRAKVADDTSDDRGDQAASDLLHPTASRPRRGIIYAGVRLLAVQVTARKTHRFVGGIVFCGALEVLWSRKGGNSSVLHWSG
jgi:integrase